MNDSVETTRKEGSERHWKFVSFVASCLEETDPLVIDQIHEVVYRLGAQKVLVLLKEVLAIELSGGITVMDSSRRRTPGGVFFFLCKRHYKRQLANVLTWRSRGDTSEGGQ